MSALESETKTALQDYDSERLRVDLLRYSDIKTVKFIEDTLCQNPGDECLISGSVALDIIFGKPTSSRLDWDGLNRKHDLDIVIAAEEQNLRCKEESSLDQTNGVYSSFRGKLSQDGVVIEVIEINKLEKALFSVLDELEEKQQNDSVAFIRQVLGIQRGRTDITKIYSLMGLGPLQALSIRVSRNDTGVTYEVVDPQAIAHNYKGPLLREMVFRQSLFHSKDAMNFDCDTDHSITYAFLLNILENGLPEKISPYVFDVLELILRMPIEDAMLRFKYSADGILDRKFGEEMPSNKSSEIFQNFVSFLRIVLQKQEQLKSSGITEVLERLGKESVEEYIANRVFSNFANTVSVDPEKGIAYFMLYYQLFDYMFPSLKESLGDIRNLPTNNSLLDYIMTNGDLKYIEEYLKDSPNALKFLSNVRRICSVKFPKKHFESLGSLTTSLPAITPESINEVIALIYFSAGVCSEDTDLLDRLKIDLNCWNTTRQTKPKLSGSSKVMNNDIDVDSIINSLAELERLNSVNQD